MDNTNALQNLLNRTASEEEIQLFKQDIVSGEISIGGNVSHSVSIFESEIRLRPSFNSTLDCVTFVT